MPAKVAPSYPTADGGHLFYPNKLEPGMAEGEEAIRIYRVRDQL